MNDLFGFDGGNQKNQDAPQNTATTVKNKKLKFQLLVLGRFYKILTVAAIIIFLYMIYSFSYTRNYDKNFGEFTLNYYYCCAIALCAIIVCVIIGLPYLFFPSPLPDSATIELMVTKMKGAEKYLSFSSKAKHCVTQCFISTVILIYAVLFMVFSLFSESAKTFIVSYIIVITVSIIFLIISAINFVTVKKFKKSWETSSVLIDAIAMPDVEKYAAKKQKYYDMRDKARTSSGKGVKSRREYDIELFFKKWGTAFLVAVAFMGFCVYQAFFNAENTNYQAYIQQIQEGDHLAYAYRILGEPMDRRDYVDIDGQVISGVWIWCDSPLAKQIAEKNKKLEKLTGDADDFDLDDLEIIMKLSEEIANLEEKLLNEPCNYLYISYEGHLITNVRLVNSNDIKTQTRG